MKALPDYIEIICPKCGKQARYDLPKHLFLKKGEQYISGYIHLERKLKQILEQPDLNLNHYSVVFDFGGSKNTKITLREFLEIKAKANQRHRFTDVRRTGWGSCLSCGFSKAISFHPDLYYYRISIGNRYVVARTRERFLIIKNEFEQASQWCHDPELDYPKLFWQHKDLILERMNKLLKQER